MSSSPAQASLIGRTLGHYQVEALIGRGAMGTVYLAKDTRLNRLVALKVLLGSFAQSAKLVAQFHAEAYAAAPLRHENVVRIYTAGTEDGIPYIAMEFVDGEPLDHFLRRKGKVDWAAAMYMAGQVALALDCAHEHGVVHRDVKPSNIMLDRKGRIRLTDFGIARMQSGEGQAGPASRFIGTPQYMSPEQCLGKTVGPQSDLYSLGVCLYQMISGTMPFEGESTMALINAICSDEPPRLNKLDPSIPDDVSRVVAYLMEKEPDMRPASARTAHALMRRTRKQEGSYSAVAESIRDFIKTETEVRPFSRMYEERQSGVNRKSKSTVRRTLPTAWVAPVARAAALAACAAAAFAAPLALASRDNRVSAAAPPVMAGAVFEASGPGDTRIALDVPAYQLTHFDWAGDGPELIVRAEGRAGGMAQGLWGLLQISPQRQRVFSLVAPDAVATTRRDILSAASFDNGTMLAVDDPASGAVVVLLQPLGASVPNPEVIARIPRDRWRAPAHADPAERHHGTLSVSADGTRLAYLLWDAVSNGYGIVLQDRTLDAPQTPGEVRTSRRGSILPGSVSFSPDGTSVAYLREAAGGLSELWLLPVDQAGLDGDIAALRVVGNTYSFSPDGRLIAVTTASREDPEHALRVIDTILGQNPLRVPNGRVAPEAWHAASNTLVFAAPDATGSEMLYAVEPAADAAPRVLHPVALGARDTYSVSPDGRWVAVSTEDGRTIRLLEWNELNRRSRAAAAR